MTTKNYLKNPFVDDDDDYDLDWLSDFDTDDSPYDSDSSVSIPDLGSNDFSQFFVNSNLTKLGKSVYNKYNSWKDDDYESLYDKIRNGGYTNEQLSAAVAHYLSQDKDNDASQTTTISITDKKESGKQGMKIPKGNSGYRFKLFRDAMNYANSFKNKYKRQEQTVAEEPAQETKEKNYTIINGSKPFQINGTFDDYDTDYTINYNFTPMSKAADVIKKQEGFSSNPYKDVGGWSVGYGFYTKGNNKPASMTKEEADAKLENMLQDDIFPFLKRNIKTYDKLNDNQKAALASYTWNIGQGNFLKQKNLMQALNNEDWAAAAHYIEYGIRTAGGKTLTGLVNRRKYEAKLFLS